MANDNTVTIVGNLADDPELRHTTGGVPVAGVRVAVNQRFFDKEANAWDERLDGYFSCNVWRDQATNAAVSLKRGDRVLVTGRLRSRSYEKEGQTRWVTEIEVDEIAPTLRFATARPQRAGRGDAAAPSDDGAPSDSADRSAEPSGSADPAAEPVPAAAPF